MKLTYFKNADCLKIAFEYCLTECVIADMLTKSKKKIMLQIFKNIIKISISTPTYSSKITTGQKTHAKNGPGFASGQSDNIIHEKVLQTLCSVWPC